MRWLAEIRERLRSFVFRQREEREMEEELRFHLDMETERLQCEGLGREEAARRARLTLGGVEGIKEEVRDARGTRVVEDLIADVRFALRTLSRERGFTVAVVLVLALGIGAGTALFVGVKGLLLDTLPVRDPGSLVRLRWTGDNDMAVSTSSYGHVAGGGEEGLEVQPGFSYPLFEALRDANTTLSSIFASAPSGRMHLLIDGEAEIGSGVLVSGNFFEGLGVRAQLGRAVGPADDEPAASPVAAISHAFWARRFGLDPEVVGRGFSVNGQPVTVVGVLPRSFTSTRRPDEPAPDVQLPLSLRERVLSGAELRSRPGWWWLQIMGRREPGVDLEQVRSDLEGPFREAALAGIEDYLARLSPEERALPRNRERTSIPRLLVESGARGLYDPYTPWVRQATLLGVIVALVLLVVCTNTASLVLARSAKRGREITLRRSLGATRGRIVRQLVTEGTVLALLGGVVGLAVGSAARLLLPFGRSTTLDWRVPVFVVALSLVVALGTSLAPALLSASARLDSGLRQGQRTLAPSRGRFGQTLVTVQVALSLVLLVGAGLFVRTLANLKRVDVGFETSNVLLFHLDPRLVGLDPSEVAALYDRVVASLRAVPVVAAVSLSDVAFLTSSTASGSIFLDGSEHQEPLRPLMNMVSPEFFETLGIPLLRGRLFDERDHATAPGVVILNETAAELYFDGEDPIGRRLGRGPESRTDFEVVGIVRDAKYVDLRSASPPTLYWAHAQRQDGRGRVFEVRTTVAPAVALPQLREAVRNVDPRLPLIGVQTQLEAIEDRLEQERLFARALSLFGGLALVLAAVGLFGLVSYAVGRRSSEFGVRMALGACRADIRRLVVREGIALAAVGVLLGLAGAWLAGRWVQSLLYGLAPTDPLTTLSAVGLLLGVAGLASYLPARQAATVDPAVAIRAE